MSTSTPTSLIIGAISVALGVILLVADQTKSTLTYLCAAFLIVVGLGLALGVRTWRGDSPRA